MASEFEMPSCVRGFQVYQENWNPVLGETLLCTREPAEIALGDIPTLKEPDGLGRPSLFCRYLDRDMA